MLPALTIDSSGKNLTTTIPVTNVGYFQFYVYARNMYNDYVFTDMITINVVGNCSADKIYLRSDEVSAKLADTINPSVAHFWDIDFR